MKDIRKQIVKTLLERVINNITLRQSEPEYADTVRRSQAITDVLSFCEGHQHLSAGEIFEGATTGMSLKQNTGVS